MGRFGERAILGRRLGRALSGEVRVVLEEGGVVVDILRRHFDVAVEAVQCALYILDLGG